MTCGRGSPGDLTRRPWSCCAKTGTGETRRRRQRRHPLLRAGALQELGAELNHPVYDCVYVALAEAESAAFLTADRKLVDLVLANRPGLLAYWVAQEIPKVLH